MNTEYYSNAAVLLAYASSLAALAAALGALLQARRTAQTNAAQLFLSFSARYNSQEMADAFRQLVKWRLSTGENFAMVWNQLRQKGDKEALSLNRARRLVSRYYYDVARLRQVGLINTKLARALLANNGLMVFYQVCEPLNDARHNNRERSYSQTLKKIRASYGEGRIHTDPSDVSPR
jgi:hypothetical protein